MTATDLREPGFWISVGILVAVALAVLLEAYAIL